ncbi:MAG: CBS domain-containing protein [Thermoprotei archaeon]
MSTPVVTCHMNDNLAHVRNLLLRHDIGRVVVVDDGHVTGVVTWTDLIKAFVSLRKRWASRPIDEVLVKHVMTRNPILIRQTRSIRMAAKTMVRYGVSGLPTVDQQKTLVGIITKTDIVRAMPRTRSSRLSVSEVMTTDVITLSPNHTLYRAASLMAQNKISHLVVAEGGSPVGIISKIDLASYAPLVPIGVGALRKKFVSDNDRRVYYVPVAAELMTTKLFTVKPDATLLEASKTMLEHGISSLPVVDDTGRLVGIITKSDLVRAVARFR